MEGGAAEPDSVLVCKDARTAAANNPCIPYLNLSVALALLGHQPLQHRQSP